MPTDAALTLEPKAKLFRGFADLSRLRIVESLRAGPKTVTDICAETALTQSNVSNHLACLLGCRLVAREPRGRFAYYRLAHERIELLLSLAEEIAGGGEDSPCCPICGSPAP